MASQLADECLIAGYGPRWLGEAGVVAAVVDALAAHPALRPDKMGNDERRLKAYSGKALVTSAPKVRGREWLMLLERDHPPKLRGSIGGRAETGFGFGFGAEGLDGWKPVFDLGADLAARAHPEVMAIAPSFERRDPRDGEDAETLDWIVASASVSFTSLRREGLVGLTPRTYFGPEVVALIGRERIDRLPVPHEWLGWGGVRIDLIAEPWKATPEAIVGPWRQAMAILRESEVFSTGYPLPPHGTLIAKRGKRWPL